MAPGRDIESLKDHSWVTTHLSSVSPSVEGPGSLHFSQEVAGCTWMTSGLSSQHGKSGPSWLTEQQDWDYGLEESGL